MFVVLLSNAENSERKSVFNLHFSREIKPRLMAGNVLSKLFQNYLEQTDVLFVGSQNINQMLCIHGYIIENARNEFLKKCMLYIVHIFFYKCMYLQNLTLAVWLSNQR